MCMVHNSLFRGYNSIFHQASHVAEADKADFIGYCLTWHKFLTAHAENEERSLFPRTEELLGDTAIWEAAHQEHGACFLTG
jgi:hemerythrin superfamily protein